MTQPDSDEVGSLAQEAARLFQALASGVGGEGQSEHACSTSWCPVCQLVAAVRSHPEAVAAVAASAVELASAVKDLLEHVVGPREDQ